MSDFKVNKRFGSINVNNSLQLQELQIKNQEITAQTGGGALVDTYSCAGVITPHSNTVSAGSSVHFTVANTYVFGQYTVDGITYPGSNVFVNVMGNPTAGAQLNGRASTVNDGEFTITVDNTGATANSAAYSIGYFIVSAP